MNALPPPARTIAHRYGLCGLLGTCALFAWGVFVFSGSSSQAQVMGVNSVVEMSAAVQTTPSPQVTLTIHPEDPGFTAAGYATTRIDIYRRLREDNLRTIYRSTDGGANWSLSTPGDSLAAQSVAWGNPGNTEHGIWVAVGFGLGVRISTDGGQTWSTPTLPSTMAGDDTHATDYSVAYGAGRFVIVGGVLASTSAPTALHSTNGTTWTTQALPSNTAQNPTGRRLRARRIVFQNNQFVIVGGNDDMEDTSQYPTPFYQPIAQTSPDGLTWSNRLQEVTYKSIRGAAAGTPAGASTVWVAVGQAGTIFRSTNDAAGWSMISPFPTTANLHDVAFGAGLFVAVGARESDGTTAVYTSANGTANSWTKRTVPTVQNLNSIVWDGGKFIAVGDSGAVITSADGITWTSRNGPSTGASLTAIGLGPSNLALAVNNLSFGSPYASFVQGNGGRTFVDTAVEVGRTYEYVAHRWQATNTSDNAKGFITVPVAAPLQDAKGKLLLVLDTNFTSSLATELERFRRDLAGEGWTVVDVPIDVATATAASVKAAIKAQFDADPTNVKSVILFGRIPYAYAGWSANDGHSENQGAWTADTFYADMDGQWTDVVNYGTSGSLAKGNNAGDGFFDQDQIPSPLELSIGRIDLRDLPVFSLSETELLRRYLQKNHAYRTGQLRVAQRGLSVNVGTSFFVASFANLGVLTQSPIFGSMRSPAFTGGRYFTGENLRNNLLDDEYAMVHGFGFGQISYSDLIGAGDLAQGRYKSIFMGLFGSYFGNFDKQNNLLRSVLGMDTYGLVSWWANAGGVSLHNMGAGLSVGEAFQVTMNQYMMQVPLSRTGWSRSIESHQSLLGDPTLRLQVFAAPRNPQVARSGSTVTLDWSHGPDSVEGYHIYRGTSAFGPFTRLTSSPLAASATQFVDTTAPASGNVWYQVRGIRLESVNSGSFFNASPALLIRVADALTAGVPTALTATTVSPTRVDLQWTRTGGADETGFEIQRKGIGGSFATIGRTGIGATTFADTTALSPVIYTYRVRAFNNAGTSAWSNEVTLFTRDTASAAPTNPVAWQISSTSIGLRWADNSPAESGFQILRSTYADGGFTVVATTQANTTLWRDTGLAANTRYYYRIRALNAGGASAETAVVTASTAPIVDNDALQHSTFIAGQKESLAVDGQWYGHGVASQRPAPEADRTGGGLGLSIGDDNVDYQVSRFTPTTAMLGGAAFDGAASLIKYTFWLRMPTKNLSTDYAGAIHFSRTSAGNPTGYVFLRNDGRARLRAANPSDGAQIEQNFRDAGNNDIDLSTGWHRFEVFVQHGPASNTVRRMRFYVNGVLQTHASAPDGWFLWLSNAYAAATTAFDARIQLQVWNASTVAGLTWYCDDIQIENVTPTGSTPFAARDLLLTGLPGSGIRIDWQDRSVNETGFEIQRRTSGGEWATVGTVGAEVTTFTDATAVTGVLYEYQVRPTGATNGAWTAAASGLSPAVQAAPSGLPQVNIYASPTAATEGDPAHAIILERVGSTSGSLAVNFTIGGTATPGVDYATLPTGATFQAGESILILPLQTVNDGILESGSPETVIATLTPHGSYEIGASNQATASLTDTSGNFAATAPVLALASANSDRLGLAWTFPASNATQWRLQRQAPQPGSLVLYEGFNYTANSNLIGNAGWVQDNANTGEHLIVRAGNLSYLGLNEPTGNRIEILPSASPRSAERSFTQSGTNLFCSFLLRVDNISAVATTWVGLTRLEDPTATPVNGLGIAIRRNGSNFDLGIHKRANSGSSESAAALQNLVPGTTYLIVASYEVVAGTGNDPMRIWVNPTNLGNNGSMPMADFSSVTGSDTSVNWNKFVFAPAAQLGVTFDELRVGTDWAAVTFNAWGNDQILPATPNTTTVNGLAVETSYTFRIRAEGGSVISLWSNALTASTTAQSLLTASQQWLFDNFGTSEATGNAAWNTDPDGDGVANIIEYALGGTPTNPGSRPQVVVGTSGQRLTLSFTPQVVSGLTYRVEASSDLLTWSEQTTLTGLTPGLLHTHTDSVDLGPAAPRRFLRLRVLLP